MNKTQKGAWFNLVVTLLIVAFSIYIVVEISIFRKIPQGSVLFWALLIFGFMGLSTTFLCKKQSPTEIDSDERDNLIKKRAVLVCFASVWILLIASSVIPWFIVGEEGSIPVWMLPIINLGVFLIAMLVYSIAVLVQYGWGDKDG